MPELRDIINEAPPELTDPTETEVDEEEAVKPEEPEPQPKVEPDEPKEDKAEETETAEDNDDYFTTAEETLPAQTTPQPPAQPDDAAKFILDGLAKIPVRIVAGDDTIQTVEVYGFGDLPRDYKGFATPYEQGVFQAAVTAQELKARELQTQFNQLQSQKQADRYVELENQSIAEDLTELRQDGVFPKFKGNPGSREFNESDGGKEFDRVLAFMNERNDAYAKRAQSGKAYRHIGFREAFELLNGPNLKAAEQAETKARREVAAKTVSQKGTTATTAKAAPKRVTNLTDLTDEFLAMGNQ